MVGRGAQEHYVTRVGLLGQRGYFDALEGALAAPDGWWCDDKTTSALETCPQQVDRALTAALDELQAAHGTDVAAWQWSRAHVARSEHRPFSKVKLLARWFEQRVPVGGDSYTVNVSRVSLKADATTGEYYLSEHGPSLRGLYDLADRANSRVVHSTGQSGIVWSPLFRSLAGEAGADTLPRVALLLPAIPQAYFALWGAEAAGVACPLNYLLDLDHLAELIDRAGANLLVALGPHPELDIWPRALALQARCPGLRRVLAVHLGDGPAADGALDFDTARAAQPASDWSPARPVEAGTLAALFHTGGTTGAPKLAQHSHGNQLHAAWSAAQLYAMDERDVILNGFPLFHVAGSLVFGLSTLLSGGEVVLPTLLGLRNPRFVARYWQAVAEHGVTLLAAVPTVIAMLMALDPPAAGAHAVRALLTGGSPLPPELAEAFERRCGIPVRNILGMTECAGIVSVEPFLAPRVPGSCGLRLPFSRVEAVAADGSVCAPGEPGVLRLRGPHVGAGYTDPARNAGSFSADGWLGSGDIGHVDAEGRVFVTGRAKDVIIRGGHNIDPALVEEALMRHPAVAFAAAVGAPDERAGEVPVAFVALKPGAAVDGAALIDFARAHIAEPPALPKRVDVLPALPMTAIGKVYKPALRLRAIERVLGERLAAAGLAQQVRLQGRDEAAGLFLAVTPAPGMAAEAVVGLEADVRALMGPFAIRWAWLP